MVKTMMNRLEKKTEVGFPFTCFYAKFQFAHKQKNGKWSQNLTTTTKNSKYQPKFLRLGLVGKVSVSIKGKCKAFTAFYICIYSDCWLALFDCIISLRRLLLQRHPTWELAPPIVYLEESSPGVINFAFSSTWFPKNWLKFGWKPD